MNNGVVFNVCDTLQTNKNPYYYDNIPIKLIPVTTSTCDEEFLNLIGYDKKTGDFDINCSGNLVWKDSYLISKYNNWADTTDANNPPTIPVMPGGMNHVPTITLPTPAIIDKGGTILDSKEIANPNKLSTKLAGHPNSIKQGTKNNSFVGLVNQALTKLGYKTNSGNGYGDTTAAAVKKFCQDNKVNINPKTKKTKASGKTMGNDFFKKLISVLKAKGYSRGGVITDDNFDLSNLGIRTNNGDTKLITVKNGERVLTPIQNQNFEELIKYLQANPIVPNIPTNLVSNIPQAKNVGGNSYSTNIEHVDLSFPDVTNYEDFVQKLKHDNTTLKYIAAQTAGAYVGKNSLKNRL